MTKKSEAAVSQEIQLEASRRGVVLWRNNVGAAVDHRGIPVRYGLANISKAMNAKYKSGDFIGITPTLITQDMVGLVIGVFTSIEAKHSEWVYKGAGREVAQNNWLKLIKNYGGIAVFATGSEDIWPRRST